MIARLEQIHEVKNFILKKFPYWYDTETDEYIDFIIDNFDEIVDFFGEDGFESVSRYKWKYFENSRWTYFYDTIYFKTEEDFIIFRMKFL